MGVWKIFGKSEISYVIVFVLIGLYVRNMNIETETYLNMVSIEYIISFKESGMIKVVLPDLDIR